MNARLMDLFLAALLALGPGAAVPGVAGEPASPLDDLRLLATAPARFEWVFTGATTAADGQVLLAFNHRNGRTWFVAPGDSLGDFRVASYEAKTRRVHKPSLNATLDEPAGSVTLVGPGGERVVLEQDQPLPRPGRAAWLADLDSGVWWPIQELDVFFLAPERNPVCVEEIDEEGVMLSDGRGNPVFIPRIAEGEREALDRLWADRRRREQQQQELAAQRRQEEAGRAAAAAAPSAVPSAAFSYSPAAAVPRRPSFFFYGCEYRYPDAYAGYASPLYVNGRFITSHYVIVPTHFKTRTCGTLVTWP